MADKIARRLLGNLLAAARIDEGTFYRLAEALFECPHIDPESVMLTEPARGEFELRARYTGHGQIGNALTEGRRIDTQIQGNAENIYRDISEASYVRLDSGNERASPLHLILYQTRQEITE